MRNLAISIVLFMVSTAVALGLLELGVRLFFPAFDPSGHVTFTATPEGATIGAKTGTLRQIKNTGDYDVGVTISELGLREPKPLAEATADDVFVVGDSFSFGWGVEETERYSDRLDAALADRRVFNISAPTDVEGYAAQIAYAQAHGATVGEVVIGLCLENDIHDYEARKRAAPVSKPSQDGSVLQGLKNTLHRKSAAYFMVTTLIHGTPALRKLAISLGLVRTVEAGLHTQTYDAAAIASTVNATKALIDAHGGAVLIIPSRALWTGAAAQRAEAARIHDAVVAGLRAGGVTVVDPRPEMEATGSPLDFHFAHDGHWTPRGHALAARLLAKALTAPR